MGHEFEACQSQRERSERPSGIDSNSGGPTPYIASAEDAPDDYDADEHRALVEASDEQDDEDVRELLER
jgi:hypothetical protein